MILIVVFLVIIIIITTNWYRSVGGFNIGFSGVTLALFISLFIWIISGVIIGEAVDVVYTEDRIDTSNYSYREIETEADTIVIFEGLDIVVSAENFHIKFVDDESEVGLYHYDKRVRDDLIVRLHRLGPLDITDSLSEKGIVLKLERSVIDN